MMGLVLSIVLSFCTILWAKDGQLKTTHIKINGVTLRVELAKTEEEQAQGLMFRKKISDSEGMLFVYKDERPRSFWMKNTFIPLSIGFFNKKRELIDVQDMTPVQSEMQIRIPSYRSKKPAQYALEVKQGWFQRHRIQLGARFQFAE